MYNIFENGVIFMGNCKKCGALIGEDYVFCGKCGAPVCESRKQGRFIKHKNIKKLKRLEKKLSSSSVLNLVMSGICAAVSFLWIFFFFGGCTDIRISSASIGDTIGQLAFKYNYVKEGLSLSYISGEFARMADYIVLWAFTVFSILMAAAGIILAVTYIINYAIIRKGKRYPALIKFGTFIFKLAVIPVVLFVLIFIVTVIMKGVI